MHSPVLVERKISLPLILIMHDMGRINEDGQVSFLRHLPLLIYCVFDHGGDRFFLLLS